MRPHSSTVATASHALLRRQRERERALEAAEFKPRAHAHAHARTRARSHPPPVSHSGARDLQRRRLPRHHDRPVAAAAAQVGGGAPAWSKCSLCGATVLAKTPFVIGHSRCACPSLQVRIQCEPCVRLGAASGELPGYGHLCRAVREDACTLKMHVALECPPRQVLIPLPLPLHAAQCSRCSSARRGRSSTPRCSTSARHRVGMVAQFRTWRSHQAKAQR